MTLKSPYLESPIDITNIARWSVTGLGSIAMDNTVLFNGNSSLKVSTPATQGFTYPRFTFAAPLDLTNGYLCFWMKVDPYSAIENAYARVINTSSPMARWNYYQPHFKVIQPGNIYWVRITLPFGAATNIEGSPSLSSITSLLYEFKNTGAAAMDIWIGGISIIANAGSSIVSFVFDDGLTNTYDYAFPKLETYDYPATAYIIPDQVGTASHMTLTQLRELQNTYGWDIASHHQTDFRTLNEANLLSTIQGIKSYLSANGLNGGNHLAYPSGGFNNTVVVPAIKNYFNSARTVANPTIESYPPADWHRLRTYEFNTGRTLAEAEAYVDALVTKTAWMIITAHSLVDSNPGTDQWTKADFNALVDYINAAGIQVKTVSEVWSQYIADTKKLTKAVALDLI